MEKREGTGPMKNTVDQRSAPGRRLSHDHRGVVPWQAVVVILGLIVLGVIFLFAAAYIFVFALLILGGLVMLLGPKPYSIWIGLAMVLIAFLAFLSAQNGVLHLSLVGVPQL
jgi:hypothetical protein